MQKYASKKSNRFVEKKSIVVPKNSGIREAFYEVNLDAKKFTRNKRTKERKYDISNSNLQFSACKNSFRIPYFYFSNNFFYKLFFI